jgi:L,D-transpeptidase ErfK/SrfK
MRIIILALMVITLFSAPAFATDKKESKMGPERPAIDLSKADAAASEEALAVEDADENYDLPEYPMGARIGMGEMKTYMTEEEDTFLDIARHFGLGYIELRAANLNIDPWSPIPGTELTIPEFQLLPRARQEGVVVNLGKMRLYYFNQPGKPPISYAIGIGREGLQTPTGKTTIIRKTAGPQWFPTERMRKEKPYLPAAVPAGPSNPLGTHALYLGWPTFLVHGSNKPWGIGRRVSSGCMRLYPEDIIKLFDMLPVGTKVTVVDQPILVGWIDNTLYLEANPSKTQGNDIEIEGEFTPKPMTDKLKNVITEAAGVAADTIDWDAVEKIVRERKGYPQPIATAGRPEKIAGETDKKAPGKKSERSSRLHQQYN